MSNSVLNPSQIYQGIITARRGRVYDVNVESHGVTLTGCLHMACLVSELIGIKAKMLLSPGTRVAVLGCVPGLIVGGVSSGAPDREADGAFRATATEDSAPQTPGLFDDFHGDRMPADAVEGEFFLENDLGVGVQVLTTLAKLKASELAKVEAFALDDHVRIISRTFSHLTDFGDLRVVNDNGRITVVQHGTSLEHEAFGALEEKSPKAEVKEFVVSEVAETGRWRFSQYVGFLGDFLHSFYTDPVNAIGALAQDRAGKLRVWHGNDGTFLVSSIGDIVLERVTAIPVPAQQLELHDTNGNTAPDATFLDSWRFDAAQPWKAAFQLREYARWLNQYHAYAAFLRNPKDWSVASEAAVPAAKYQTQDAAALRQPEAQQTPRLTYACYRIMRDGSIVSLNGYGSCVMQAGPDISISAPRDITIEAGRDVVLLAGNSVFAKARKHVELTAVTGAFIAKARTRWAGICEQGTLLLRTLMQAGAAPETEPATHRFNDLGLGLVLDAPNASAVVSSGRTTTLEGGINLPDDDAGGVDVRAPKGDIKLRTSPTGKIRMRALTLAVNVTQAAITATKYFRLQTAFANLNRAVLLKNATTYVRSLVGERLLGRYIASGTAMTGRAIPNQRGAPPHTNHIGLEENAEAFNQPDLPAEDTSVVEDVAGILQVSGLSVTQAARVVSEHLPPFEYQREPIEQSLAQQIAEQSPQHPSGGLFAAWMFDQDGVNADPQAINKLPWPGSVRRMNRYYSAQSLHTPSTEKPDAHIPNRAQAPETIAPRMMTWHTPQ